MIIIKQRHFKACEYLLVSLIGVAVNHILVTWSPLMKSKRFCWFLHNLRLEVNPTPS